MRRLVGPLTALVAAASVTLLPATPSAAAECTPGDPVAAEAGVVDAALGTRYLAFEVTNCSRGTVKVRRPTLVAAHPRGGDVVMTVVPTGARPDRALTLAPGETAYAGLRWRAAPSTRRVSDLRVATRAGDKLSALDLDVVDIRARTRVDYYPWVDDPSDVFG